MLQDLRYAFRQLRRSPGFAALAILMLALGIGGSTVFFSTLRALVLEPLPYPHSARLVQVWSGESWWPLSHPDYCDLQEALTSVEDFGVYMPQPANLGGDRPRSLTAVVCTPEVLRVFGVEPQLGRLLTAADDEPGAAPVAVISHSLWRTTFNADPAIIGRTVPIDNAPTMVVGVMPAQFEFASPWLRGLDCQLWRPLQFKRGTGNRGNHWLCGLARLKEGTSFETAAAELASLGRRLSAAYPETNTTKPFRLQTLHEEMSGPVAGSAWMLFGAVLLVLLIACSNVASLLLARGAVRQAELGVRTAIGATRGQLFRLVLGESLLLAAAAALIGFLLANHGGEALSAYIPATTVRRAAAEPDLVAFLFATGLALVATLLAGVPAAFAATRTNVAEALRGDSRNASGSAARHRLLRSLIVGQIVLAFLLANGAVLLTSSYLKIRGANRDLASPQVLAATLHLRGERYADPAARTRFCERLVAVAGALPGVTAAGTTSKLPLEGGNNTNILVGDQTFDAAVRRAPVEVSAITPGYFAAVGQRLLRGRLLRPEDAATNPVGVVVNRTLAEQSWPGQDPIGQLVRANKPVPDWTATVVGVVEDVRQWGPTTDPQPEIYWDTGRAWNNNVFLLLRSDQSAAGLAEPLRRLVAMIDPDLPLAQVRTLEQLVDETTASQRLFAWLVGLFMGVALLLVAAGLFGTLSYLVQQRTREIGIRLALGAAPASIGRMVIGQGLRWVLLGSALGLGGAVAAAGALRSLLWGVEPVDPLALAAGIVAIVLVGLVACWLPTLRAARTDPLVALRAE